MSKWRVEYRAVSGSRLIDVIEADTLKLALGIAQARAIPGYSVEYLGPADMTKND